MTIHINTTAKQDKLMALLSGAAIMAALVLVPTTSHARGRWVLKGHANINEAPAKVLMLLPGVGPSKVKKIIEMRARRRFRKPRDLMKVKGIGWKSYKKMRKFLTVSGPTDLRRIKVDANKKEVRKAYPLGKSVNKGSTVGRSRNKSRRKR